MTTAERLDALDRDASEGSRLTSRQREVLRLLADGCTDREIGELLFITEHTVGTQVGRVMRKLGARNRAGAVHRGWLAGILS